MSNAIKMENHNFRVRDLRKKEQFIIDDVYLNGYARIFGPNGTAVYLTLCRRAGKDQSCYPSEKSIAKDHDITDRTVRKYIKIFEQSNLIRIGRKRSNAGTWLHNVYYLLDKSEWKKPEEIISAGYQGKIKTSPKENNNQNQRKYIPLKDAHTKEAHRKDGPIKKSSKENRASPVNDFVPDNSDESRCLQIAQWLGEENMNFMLYGLKRYGIRKIEQTFGVVKEDAERKAIRDKRSYFNAVLRNIGAVEK